MSAHLSAFSAAFRKIGKAVMTAACIMNWEALERVADGTDGMDRRLDYIGMPEKENLDLVII